ncbi:MAG: hypothetical protein OEL83_15590 [Desulforhopalus sp.]|nr:hypothetical protein [Desulforhopalus sp.]
MSRYSWWHSLLAKASLARVLASGVFLLLVNVLFCSVGISPSRAEGIRGIYGLAAENLDATLPRIKDAHVTSVFVAPHQPSIAHLKQEGVKVFLTLNAFGGREGWDKYPDSVPVTASGEAISPRLGGICPSHPAWRADRLRLLAAWLEQFGDTEEGIDGVWLDFIRYPGHWESSNPDIPDTCYCPRCLQLFQTEKGVAVPQGLSVRRAAEWIHIQAEEQWRQWKKEQIVSFVRDVRALIDSSQGGGRIKLGAFLVPWRQGERGGAVLAGLAQDARQLAPYVDVFSPMVYHQMLGQNPGWVRDISEYFHDVTGKAVWPIVQAGQVEREEFAEAGQAVRASGAEGMLVYTLPAMQQHHWLTLGQFQPLHNLLPNPQFRVASEDSSGLPEFWRYRRTSPAIGDKYLLQPATAQKNGALGLTAGIGHLAQWSTGIAPCEPHKSYHFSGEFFRDDHSNTAYPEVVIWGQSYRLNTHRLQGQYQKLDQAVQCPDTTEPRDNAFLFKNTSPGITFWLQNPQLREDTPRWIDKNKDVDSGFFPIGVYGGSLDNIGLQKEMGLNSTVLPMEEKTVDACIAQDMHCLLAVPRDPEKLLLALPPLEKKLAAGRFSFYVNDEPEIHSFPPSKAQDIALVLRDRFPGKSTSMAVVRPQGIPAYAGGADYFMLDQYPVPSMPMTWLADSMDEAAVYVGKNRLQSVIQAFGGVKHASSGWPRLPTFAEMNCLAFLSVIHGSRGIYFFSWDEITGDKGGKSEFQEVVARLQKMLAWLQLANLEQAVALTMTSLNRLDPLGKPAVHCAMKETDAEQMVLCANTLSTYTSAAVTAKRSGRAIWREYFDDSRVASTDSVLHLDFAPLEVKVLVREK